MFPAYTGVSGNALMDPTGGLGQFRAGLETHLFKQAYRLGEHFVLRV